MTKKSAAAASAASRRIQEITLAAIETLHPHPENPRRISRDRLEQLKRSLEADPDMLRARPLIALPDGTVFAGNQRLRAAVDLGWREVPVVYADVELALAGFEGAEGGRSRPEPDDAPPVPKKPRSRLGEVYELGPHRLICGDATDPAVLDALLEGHAVDLLFTDPPYGVDYEGRTKDKLRIQNDASDFEQLEALASSAFAAVAEQCRPGACWYVAVPSGPQLACFTRPLLELGIWRQTIVWIKDVFVLGRSDYHYRHEALLYAEVDGPGVLAPPELAYDETGADFVLYGWEPRAPHQRPPSRKQDTVWSVPRPKRSADHPTMKRSPRWLLLRTALATSSTGFVLDPFAGSGSTMIAADQLGRRAFMVELDPGYCDVIRDRWEAWNAD